MGKKYKRCCSLCNKDFKQGEKRKYYTIYNYGLKLKIHLKCWKRAKAIAIKRKWTISKVLYSMALGILRE